jgi:hypothetical protein
MILYYSLTRITTQVMKRKSLHSIRENLIVEAKLGKTNDKKN